MFRAKFGVMMVLAVLSQIWFCLAANAQSIRFYDTRGREIRSGNPFPLDRFARGETCYVEVHNPHGWVYPWIESRRGVECYFGWVWMYMFRSFRIPTDPRADSVTVHAYIAATGQVISKRIPIGSK